MVGGVSYVTDTYLTLREDKAMAPRTKILLPLTAALFSATPAPAQNSQDLLGHWDGAVTEAIDGRPEPYRMAVSIDADRNGRPVAMVSYSLDCGGVWTGAEAQGDAWHFDETITVGRDRCAPHVEVEIAREGNGLRVRLYPVGAPEQLPQGVLQRVR
jgi:hypothetical protein